MAVALDYRLKRTITFYPTVGSRLNFYRGFQRLFSVGYIRNAYSVTRLSGRPNKMSGPIVGSRSNFYWGFERLFLMGKLWNR